MGWSWVGCAGSRGPGFPKNDGVPPIHPGTKWHAKVLSTDYGTPLGYCTQTAPNSGVFKREWSKATVEVDCGKWEGTITMKK